MTERLSSEENGKVEPRFEPVALAASFTTCPTVACRFPAAVSDASGLKTATSPHRVGHPQAGQFAAVVGRRLDRPAFSRDAEGVGRFRGPHVIRAVIERKCDAGGSSRSDRLMPVGRPASRQSTTSDRLAERADGLSHATAKVAEGSGSLTESASRGEPSASRTTRRVMNRGIVAALMLVSLLVLALGSLLGLAWWAAV